MHGPPKTKLPLAGDLGGRSSGGSEGPYQASLGAQRSTVGGAQAQPEGQGRGHKRSATPTPRRGGGERGARCPQTTPDGEGLPCLFSNNCNEQGEDKAKKTPVAPSSQHRKSAAALAWNVMHMAEKFGLEHLGFLTLTFRENITDPVEAQRRLHSFKTGVLSDRYRGHIRVIERQKSGRIHYHLLVALDSDIRTGFDFEAIDRRDYTSASPALRAEWAYLRKTAKAYGFGRTELLPIKSTAEGIGRYVGKYIGKHMQSRLAEDKGVRLVEYSRSARMANTNFAWVTPGAKSWRAKLGVFIRTHAKHHGYPPTMKSMQAIHGRHWAYKWRETIAAYPEVDALYEFAEREGM